MFVKKMFETDVNILFSLYLHHRLHCHLHQSEVLGQAYHSSTCKSLDDASQLRHQFTLSSNLQATHNQSLYTSPPASWLISAPGPRDEKAGRLGIQGQYADKAQ